MGSPKLTVPYREEVKILMAPAVGDCLLYAVCHTSTRQFAQLLYLDTYIRTLNL